MRIAPGWPVPTKGRSVGDTGYSRKARLITNGKELPSFAKRSTNLRA
jgi:hypothetical protein